MARFRGGGGGGGSKEAVKKPFLSSVKLRLARVERLGAGRMIQRPLGS